MKPRELISEAGHQLGLWDRPPQAEGRLERLRDELGCRARNIMAMAPRDRVREDTMALAPDLILRRRVLHLPVIPDAALSSVIEADIYVENDRPEVSQAITLGIHDLEWSGGVAYRPAASVDVATAVSIDFSNEDNSPQQAVILEQTNPRYPVLYPAHEKTEVGMDRIILGRSLGEDLLFELTPAETCRAADRLHRDPAATFEGMHAALDQLEEALRQDESRYR